MTTSSRIVLCVDDDEDDWEMISVTIGEIDASIKVIHAHNGLEALEYLRTAKTNETPLPSLVILDINMPLMDGKRTLAAIKKDKHLKHLPVVIYSTSNNEMDKLFCKLYGVELVTKSSNLTSISVEVKAILQHSAEA